jgi:hypothetical protein
MNKWDAKGVTEGSYLFPNDKKSNRWGKYENVHNIPINFGYSGDGTSLPKAILKINISGYNYQSPPRFFLSKLGRHLMEMSDDEISPLTAFWNARAMQYSFVLNSPFERVQIITTDDVKPVITDMITGKCFVVDRYSDVCMNSADGAELFTRWVIS